MRCQLDHIVVAAATLEQGVSYIEEILGVTVPLGGEHPAMGTHNCLMQLGEGLFFEIIAISPTLPQPDRPRWFGLDNPWVQNALIAQPRLHTWVVNTDDLDQLVSAANIHLGLVEPITRGDLSWRFAVPADGHLPGSGLIPSAMQWDGEEHPAALMSDLGCHLQALEIHHPKPDWVQSVLASMGYVGEVTLFPLAQNSMPFLRVLLNTPTGIKELTSVGLQA